MSSIDFKNLFLVYLKKWQDRGVFTESQQSLQEGVLDNYQQKYSMICAIT